MGDGAGGGGGARHAPGSRHLGGRLCARGGRHKRRAERSAANARAIVRAMRATATQWLAVA
eukprot:5829668-Pleurochrysis_carterae.AAC.2